METLSGRREFWPVRVGELLSEVLPGNASMRTSLGAASLDLGRVQKAAFHHQAGDCRRPVRGPPYGTNPDPSARALNIKFHQTSGTTGRAPIRWARHEEPWDRWANCWGHVLRRRVGRGDRVFYAFIRAVHRLRAAYEGARKAGADRPGGGMQTEKAPAGWRSTTGHVRGLRRPRPALSRGGWGWASTPGDRLRATVHARAGASVPRRAHRGGLRALSTTPGRPSSRTATPGAERRSPDRVGVRLRSDRSQHLRAGARRSAG
jgi:hypothetical protein